MNLNVKRKRDRQSVSVRTRQRETQWSEKDRGPMRSVNLIGRTKKERGRVCGSGGPSGGGGSGRTVTLEIEFIDATALFANIHLRMYVDKSEGEGGGRGEMLRRIQM